MLSRIQPQAPVLVVPFSVNSFKFQPCDNSKDTNSSCKRLQLLSCLSNIMCASRLDCVLASVSALASSEHIQEFHLRVMISLLGTKNNKLCKFSKSHTLHWTCRCRVQQSPLLPLLLRIILASQCLYRVHLDQATHKVLHRVTPPQASTGCARATRHSKHCATFRQFRNSPKTETIPIFLKKKKTEKKQDM